MKALSVPSAVITLFAPNASIPISADVLRVEYPRRGNSFRGGLSDAIQLDQSFDRNRRVSTRAF